MLFPTLSQAVHKLQAWFQTHHRSLKFRSILTPYRVWIAEVMSQQTTATAVEPYFQRFLERFPDIQTLACASEEEILRLWSGLGYYSRGQNLHKAAQLIVTKYGGNMPNSIRELCEIPGIGAYTAGAMLCFGFQKPAPMVDTNIKRVLSRLRANTLSDKRLRRLSLAFAQYEDADTPLNPQLNMQSLMELGAILCHKKPECQRCPLQDICACVTQKMNPLNFPKMKTLPATLHLKEEAIFVVVDEKPLRAFLVLAKDKRWAKGLWDLPLVHANPTGKIPLTSFSISYTITHHKIQRQIFVYEVPHSREFSPFFDKEKFLAYQWVSIEEEMPVPIGSGAKKSLQKYLTWRKEHKHSLF